MIQAINCAHQELWKIDDELETRPSSPLRWVLACRPRRPAIDMDISGESAETCKLARVDQPKTADLPPRRLLARRLAEADVRGYSVHPQRQERSNIPISLKNTTRTPLKSTCPLPGC